MNEIKPLQITLPSKVVVEFGNQILAQAFLFFETAWASRSMTTLNAYLLSEAITKYGKIVGHVKTDALLALDEKDFDALSEGLNEFIGQNGVPEMIDTETLKLIYGIKRYNKTFDLVQFGKRTTGYDRIEAEQLGLTNTSFEAFLAGRQVYGLKISASKGTMASGCLTMNEINSLALVDLVGLIEASRTWEKVDRSKAKAKK